jgi:hypothetical protein
MPLTDLKVRRAKPGPKTYKLADAHGLAIHVLPTGTKSWRCKYRYAGKERQLVLGTYPEISLMEARERRDDARKALRNGRDPRAASRIETLIARRGGSTFESVAREWHKRKSPGWHSADYVANVVSQLERWVFPRLGMADIRSIRPAEMLAVLRRIEDAGFLSTARRICKTCSAVFVFGIASERAEIDPAAMVRLALTASRDAAPRRYDLDRDSRLAPRRREARLRTNLQARHALPGDHGRAAGNGAGSDVGRDRGSRRQYPDLAGSEGTHEDARRIRLAVAGCGARYLARGEAAPGRSLRLSRLALLEAGETAFGRLPQPGVGARRLA